MEVQLNAEEIVALLAPTAQRGSRPDWLRVKLPYGETYKNVFNLYPTRHIAREN